MFIKVLIQFFLLDEIGQTQIKLVRITKENNELQDEILILKQGTWYTPEQTAGEHQEERFKTYREINRKVQKKERKKKLWTISLKIHQRCTVQQKQVKNEEPDIKEKFKFNNNNNNKRA